MRHAALAAVMALLLSAGPALYADNGSAASDVGSNAALTYWRAFAISPENTPEEWLILSDVGRGRESKATPEQKEKLVGLWRDALQLMHDAAAIPQCDWGLGPAWAKEGPGLKLPHLVKARFLAEAAGLRARCLWEKGQRKEAAEDLRAALIMAHHVGNDGRDTLISVLEQMMIEGGVRGVITRLLTDREAAEIFADVLGDLSNGSSATLAKNGILTEKNETAWLRREVASQPDGVKRVADALELGYGPSEALTKLRQLQPGDMAKVPEELDELDAQYDEIAAVAGMPFQEFQASTPALEEKIKASKNSFSVLFRPVLISLHRVRLEEEYYRVRWAMVRAAIAIRRDGEGALGSVPDPSDGKSFQYTALDGGTFELKSTILFNRTGVDFKPLVMTFGHAAATKN